MFFVVLNVRKKHFQKQFWEKYFRAGRCEISSGLLLSQTLFYYF